MDRQFPTPQDAARAGAERLLEALNAWLRRGVTDQPFVLRQRFEYDGGRHGVMLFIGSINRSWRDYINANARATDLVTGTCSNARELGRAIMHMQVTGGRGATSGNQLEINRALRGANIEVRFDDGAAAAVSTPVERPDAVITPAASAPVASVAATPAPGTATAGPTDPVPDALPVDASAGTDADGAAGDRVGDVAGAPAPTAQSLGEMARQMKAGFENFRAAPTRAGLDELKAAINAWRADAAQVPGAQESKAGEFVSKLAALLDAKGEAFVSSKGG